MAGIHAHLSAPHQLPPLALDQQQKLEENFRANRNPSDLDVVIIAAEVGLPEHTVKVGDSGCSSSWCASLRDLYGGRSVVC